MPVAASPAEAAIQAAAASDSQPAAAANVASAAVVAADGLHAAAAADGSASHAEAQRLLQAVSISAGPSGRLLLVMVGHAVLELKANVDAVWEAMVKQGGDAWAALDDPFSAAVHLFDATSDPKERLGWYAAGDTQVVNSVCENYGLVTLEGMAASLPLLATRCGGTVEIVADVTTGLLHSPPGTEEAADVELVDHILRLDRRTTDGRQLGQQLGAAGCRRVRANFAPGGFFSGVEMQLRQVATVAAAAAAASDGPGSVPPEGVPKHAGMALPSGWASSFMPDPRSQARVKNAEMSWEWQEVEPAPSIFYEALSFQLNSSLYTLGGYSGQNEVVLQSMRRLDLDSFQWADLNVTGAPLPDGLSQTHQAFFLLHERHLYLAGGQTGPMCSLSTAAAYRLDLHTRQFQPCRRCPGQGTALTCLNGADACMCGEACCPTAPLPQTTTGRWACCQTAARRGSGGWSRSCPTDSAAATKPA